ncbi:MAG: hypothetical protein LBS21_07540 [Clostridiales bacterium]|nr:hypothetical protein [Clostridiales bacterium]
MITKFYCLLGWLLIFFTRLTKVAPEETLEVLAMIEIVEKHRCKFDTWVDMEDY